MGKPLNCNSARMSFAVPVTGELAFNFYHLELKGRKLGLLSLMLHDFTTFSQGGKAGAVQKCVACRGRGMRIMIRQLAPGMVQQMQSVCTDCNGEGNTSRHVSSRFYGRRRATVGLEMSDAYLCVRAKVR